MPVNIHFTQSFSGNSNSSSVSVSLSQTAPANSVLLVAFQTEQAVSLNSISAGGRTYQIFNSPGYGTASGRGSWALINAGSGGIPSGTSIGFTFSAKPNRYVGFIMCISGFVTVYDEANVGAFIGAQYGSSQDNNILTVFTLGVNSNVTFNVYTLASGESYTSYPVIVGGGSSNTAPRLQVWYVNNEGQFSTPGGLYSYQVAPVQLSDDTWVRGPSAERAIYGHVRTDISPSSTSYSYRMFHFIAQDVWTYRGAATYPGIAPFRENVSATSAEAISDRFYVWDSTYDPYEMFNAPLAQVVEVPGRTIQNITSIKRFESSSAGYDYDPEPVPFFGSTYILVRYLFAANPLTTLLSPLGSLTNVPFVHFVAQPTLVNKQGNTDPSIWFSPGQVALYATGNIGAYPGETTYSLQDAQDISITLGPLALHATVAPQAIGSGIPSAILVPSPATLLPSIPSMAFWGQGTIAQMPALTMVRPSHANLEVLLRNQGLSVLVPPVAIGATRGSLAIGINEEVYSGPQGQVLVLLGLMRYLGGSGIAPPSSSASSQPCVLTIGDSVCLHSLDAFEFSVDYNPDARQGIITLRVGTCVPNRNRNLVRALLALHIGMYYEVAYTFGMTEYWGTYLLEDMSTLTLGHRTCFDLILKRDA